MQQDRKKELS